MLHKASQKLIPTSLVNTFTPSEWFIVLFSLAFGLSAGYLLNSDFTLTKVDLKARGEPIATITSLQNNVRSRPASVPLWSAAQRRQALYQRDQIFTDKKSRTKISFPELAEIEIEEDALVVIDRDEKGAIVDVNKGKVSAQLASDQSALRFSVAGKTGVISGKNLNVAIDQENVQVLSGSGALLINDNFLSLDQDSTIDLSSVSNSNASEVIAMDTLANPTPEPTPPKTAKPIDMETAQVLALARTAPDNIQQQPAVVNGSIDASATLLSWQAVPAADSYEIGTISNASKNAPVQVVGESAETQFPLANLSPGTHVVSVRGKNTRTGTYSQWSKPLLVKITPPASKVTELTAPEQTHPLQNTAFYVRTGSENVTFTWKSSGANASYLIELSDQPDMKVIRLRRPVKGTATRVSIPKGKYFWRVVATDTKTNRSLASQITSFSIEDVGNKANLLSPSQMMKLNFDEYEYKTVDFRWENPPKVERSTISIAYDRDFTELIHQEELSSPSFTMTFKLDGTYYWMVSVYNPVAKEFVDSEIRHFTLETTEIKITKDSMNRLGLEVGTAVSNLSYTNTVSGNPDIRADASFMNSYFIALKGWVSESFGIDTELRMSSTKLNAKTEGNKTKEKYDRIDSYGAVRYRVRLFKDKYPADIGFRFGYGFEQSPAFSRKTSEDKENGKDDNTHYGVHALVGLEAQVPVWTRASIEAKLDYLHLVTAFPINDVKGSHINSSISSIFKFMRNGILGFGIFMNSLSYTYTDRALERDGKLNMLNYGMLFSLGWDI